MGATTRTSDFQEEASSETPVKAVIFDCDGTLVDSEPIGLAALLDEAAAHGLAMDAAEGEALFKGIKMAECVQEIEARIGTSVPEDFVPRVRVRMAQYFRERLQVIPGADHVMENLSLPYCIASNGPREKIQLTLEVCGLLPGFKGPIFSAYDIDSWKPAPELFLYAAKSMGFAAEECAVVEDSVPGMEAGLAAGMRVFALCSEDDIPVHLRPRVVPIGSLRELLDRLP
ncbi:HAD-IA family hydrolase [Cupriavidus pinatubonensis]|uniref:6-phosphogluconate phosphatase n=1 Tax=Cupriavidus pinatubonensis TaxID=248026 RepID=A0ABM8XSQ1_9BURK|nr:HAD-IA family hydrolase [Cupriavidus pinatubonensis]CAG9183357.1 6-phosphogluconate phosphatase [Cupriavidus pinatubonensis]